MVAFGPFSTTYQLSQLIPTYSSTIDLLRPRGKTKWKYTREGVRKEEENVEEKDTARKRDGNRRDELCIPGIEAWLYMQHWSSKCRITYLERVRREISRKYSQRCDAAIRDAARKGRNEKRKKNTFHWRIFQRRTDNRIVRPAHIILRVGRKSSRKLNNPARIETSDRHEISQPCFIESMNQRVDAFNSLPLVHDAQSTMKMSKVIKIVRIIDEIIRIAKIIHKISN